MGAMGSDAAIEAADAVLMDDDPLKIVKAIESSKKCIRIVLSEYHLCIDDQGNLSDPRCNRYCEYVGCNALRT